MSVIRYPKVVGELATVEELLRGMSIGRLGDGELAVATRAAGGRQDVASRELRDELLAMLKRPDARCLVGIPTMDKRGPKYENWRKHIRRFCTILSPDVTYWSSFITRPDSAPWIGNVEYVEKVAGLWRGKHATVIAPPGNSIVEVVRRDCATIHVVPTAVRSDYANIERYQKTVRKARPDVVVMSIGPTATVLANRLAADGIQAIDLGSAGGFMLKLMNGRGC